MYRDNLFTYCVYVLQVESIRLPTDPNTHRLKGFGYAEFKDVESLLAGLALNAEVCTHTHTGILFCYYW